MKIVAIEMETSIPDEIKYMGALGMAYVMFPSVDSACKVLNKLEGKVRVNETVFPLDFYPTSLFNSNNPNQNVNFI